MWKGAVNNDVDAMFGSTIAGPRQGTADLAARHRLAADAAFTDKAGWERVRKIGPYFTEHNATCGAGDFSKDKPIQMGAYPYPIYTVYANQAEDRRLHADQGADRRLRRLQGQRAGRQRARVKTQTKNWACRCTPARSRRSRKPAPGATTRRSTTRPCSSGRRSDRGMDRIQQGQSVIRSREVHRGMDEARKAAPTKAGISTASSPGPLRAPNSRDSSGSRHPPLPQQVRADKAERNDDPAGQQGRQLPNVRYRSHRRSDRQSAP